MADHNHIGDAAYIAYYKGCRHEDCQAAASEYRQRVRQRRENGDWTDYRRGQRIPVLVLQAKAEPVADEPEAPAEATVDHKLVEPVTVAPVAAEKQPVDHADALFNEALRLADEQGNIPHWVISATQVAQGFGMSTADAQAAIQQLWGKRLTMGFAGPKLIDKGVA